MNNNTKNDFIFITPDMIETMKASDMRNTIYGHINCYKNCLGTNHFHMLNGDVIVWDDELVDFYNVITNGWSEDDVANLNNGSLGAYIAFCNITNYFNKQPKYCLNAIRDFMCEFVKSGGLVMLDGSVYRESNELEDYINRTFLSN